MKLTRRIICMMVAVGNISGLYAQDTMTLKECMQYAVENSAKMKLQQMDVDDILAYKKIVQVIIVIAVRGCPSAFN